MSRTRTSSSIALIALTLAGGLIAVTPVLAQQAQAEQGRRPASTEERAAYGRLDPLARSVFWSREMEINPADPVAGVKLAEALRQMGQHEQAASIGQQVLVAQPANVEAMLEIGRAHIARGQAFYGIGPLEQAKALAPSDWRPLSLLGVAYQQVRRADDARTAWNQALRLSPDNPEVLTNAAMALMTGGDAGGAETLLRRAVAQPTSTLQMRLNLAMVLGLQGKTGEAEQIIRRDLPPEAADRNLEWLRNQTRPAATASVATDAASPALVRTWSSLQGQ
ncbi:MAG: tetratricopeptide repeat protein [Alphaproteobacteria bacterium]|nr:tetratricopeptide repeat protein [Alphaproteobacteria bacterium]MBU2378539.1 tetratricopeptide repeat protein [Alphaproteobacteria bacterium]